jgi:hypothetical protein
MCVASNLSPDRARKLAKAIRRVQMSLLNGKSEEAIVEYFVARNWSRETALQIVKQVSLRFDREAVIEEIRVWKLRRHRHQMIRGAIALVLGVIVMAIAHKLPSPETLMDLGAVILMVGLVDFLSGCFLSMRDVAPRTPAAVSRCPHCDKELQRSYFKQGQVSISCPQCGAVISTRQ